MMHLILNYWRNCEARGDKPRAVYAVVHGANSTQPVGYTAGWSISKRAAADMAAKTGGVTRLVRIAPV